jgi:DNA polymerase (family 10)
LGAALQRKILQGIEIRENSRGARHIHRAAELVTAAIENLKQSTPGLVSIVAAGDIRRGSELVSDLAVVAEVKRLEGAPKVVKSGELSVYVTDARRSGVSMLLATGSRRHLEALSQRAADTGMALSPGGLYRGRKVVASRTETAIYEALGLQYIEPEMREGLDEIVLAGARRIPQLVTSDDLHGVLHAHTNASDGVDTLGAMAEASRRHGYSYIGVTDHSKTAHYAGGLSIAEIDEQHAEIDRLNAWSDGSFHIFKGIASDILRNGSLDYPEEILRRFDFLIGIFTASSGWTERP